MKYAQQSTKPEWYQSDASKIYESATSGASPHNEWYEFDDRAEALSFIAQNFTSQAMYDGYVWQDREIYHIDSFTRESMEAACDSDDYVLKPGATPATIAELVQAESRF